MFNRDKTNSPAQRARSGLRRALFVAGQGLASAGAACLALDSAHAVTQFQKSVYTAIELANGCRPLRSHGYGNAYLCQGLKGYPVFLAEGDGHTYLAASTAPEHSRGATQSLESFNSPFRLGRSRATIEWRIVIRDGEQVPYAMIVRYFTRNDSGRGEVLVVSRIAGTEACQIARIDALANADAIVLARRIADERARKTTCDVAPSTDGPTGRSPM